ncbi:helicase domain-containing protein [Rhodococcus opacus RKJ300 = JCM 13270]|uniref:Helicase domain-containing protein n=1 Tax=Rhodococcus opacus RKJ300 = JCM 13270 TaxID=1165867 RepID=I0WZC7_RHOOP|nr:helicase domain-containing protein [Rhodococcus opacus RKJ300 = JCM 13270]
MNADNDGRIPVVGTQITIDGELVVVIAVTETSNGADLVVRRGDGSLGDAAVTHADLASSAVPINDAGGEPNRVLSGMWARWMQYAVPRIRSAVLATRPLRPFAHQDEAVFTHMLAQPRLRFLLADEPGTGKTIMTGMYLAEGTRRGLIPGNTIIIVPAHLVEKWRRDLRRYFGIVAERLTPEIARDPKDLDPRVTVWVVSVDLYTYNPDVRRKIAGSRASWSLTVFDEAHRLTPTSQYLGAAREVAARTHHLLLLTATPHRGKEHYFRGLMNLLDPTLYPWDPRQSEYETALRPGALSFLRRMKEELRDLDGNNLFPPRYAQTVSVDLTAAEDAAYTAAMDYVDAFYADSATLARSIYGKRAASSLTAVGATIRRRHEALKGPASGRTDRLTPEEFVDPDSGGFTAAVDDDDAWARAEDIVIGAKSRNKTEELDAVDGVLATIEAAQKGSISSKWKAAEKILADHGITPSQGQLLVFTEFTDTAVWLAAQFADAGFTVETLEGSVGHEARDHLQQRFLAGDFQVLVSTDAGGEGIDLQSANVMIDWDIPWSLVRLEQRMGRLHRIGQTKPVHIYHLVAPQTREGRVQEVMLTNLETAGSALSGRIFDLLDAVAVRSGFNYTQALLSAQTASPAAIHVPGPEELVAAARELVGDEDRLHTPANTEAALARFRDDRLESINPVIVDGFLDTLARSQHWTLSPGPAKGIRRIRSTGGLLPEALGGGRDGLVAADGSSVRQAINDGATDPDLEAVIVLGPTEEPFADLIHLAMRDGETELIRGSVMTDTASLTGYTLLIFDAEVEAHDGLRRNRRKAPILVRYSGAGAFEVAWESLMTLTVSGSDQSVAGLTPAMKHDGIREAQAALSREVERQRDDRRAWVAKAREQLDQVEYRHYEELEELPLAARREGMTQFAALKDQRLEQLMQIEKVNPTAPRLVGWVAVAAGARVTDLGYDPDSEKIAVATVLTELEKLGFIVDDRQTAKVGYDLFARHRHSGEQRLIEVKGLHTELRPVWLEQHEWAQAQQRGADYWLYVVDGCASSPTVRIRAQDPASKLSQGPRRIERFQIKVKDLKKLMEGEQ